MIIMLISVLARFLFCFTLMVGAAWGCSYPVQQWGSYCQPNRFSMRHIERGGIGYKHGYTTLEGFFAPDPNSVGTMPFLDLRGHVFNNGKLAANIGAGIRKILNERVYGFNSYYDYRNTKRMHYNQFGIGAETLGKCWDFRINGYFPFGKKVATPYQAEFVGFAGNEALVSQKNQFGMRGFNAEFGLHFGFRANFYAAAGPYYFAGNVGRKIWGGKIRFAIRFNEYVKVEFSNSYDKMFHNRFQGEITVNIPFGAGASGKFKEDYSFCALDDLLYSRMVQPVERQEIIVVGHAKVNTPAIDPETGLPYNFIFVDNTSSSLGTYESPYPTLLQAQANSDSGNIIYVFPGDGTTRGMDRGITLKANQKLWGSGVSHQLPILHGECIIPAQSASAPTLTNINGNGIILNSANQVSGLTIADITNIDTGYGIFGTNLKKIEISDCTITNCLADQIHLEYSGSHGTALLNNLILHTCQLDGIFINSTTPVMNVTVNNCTIQGSSVYSIETVFAHDACVNVTNNTIDQNTNGTIFNFNGNSTLDFSGNSITNTSSVSAAPLIVIANDNTVATTISHNRISDNTCGALHFKMNNTESAQLVMSENTVSDNGAGSLASLGSALVINLNNTLIGNCTVDLIHNSFLNNDASVVYCTDGSFHEFTVNAHDNTITNNGGSGFSFATSATMFTFNARNNIISNGQDHGIITAGGFAINTANMIIEKNQITENGNFANGIALSHEGSTLNFQVADNIIRNNDSSGILIFSSNLLENMAVTISNNTISDNHNAGSNGAGGIDLEQFTNFTGTISNNILLNNTSGGLFINSTNPSSSACLTLTGNTSDTGYLLSNQGAVFNVAPCNANSVNNGTINTSGVITSVESCSDALICPI